MSVSSFVLILWVHVFLVESVEISDVRNSKLLLPRNRRDDPSAGNPPMTREEKAAELDARIKKLKAQKKALLSITTEASSDNDMTTTEGLVPARKNESPKDGGSKTDGNIDKNMAEIENMLDSFMYKIDDKLKEEKTEIFDKLKEEKKEIFRKLKEEKTEISKVKKDEETILKNLLPDTSPSTTAKVVPPGTTIPDQGGKETTLSSETTPRSKAASADATAPVETLVNGASKKVPAKDETGDEKTDVTPTPPISIELGSGTNGGGVLICIIVVLVIIMVGYFIYVNKAKIKACYMGGEKKGEDKPGTKSRSEIKYEKLKKDDDDLTVFEKKALKSNYIY